jgi:phosphate:Na+ symporter
MFILIWFIKYIEKAVMWIIKAPKNAETETFRLKYISAGPLDTPELAAEQAFDEIIHFAEISRKGLGYVKMAVSESNPDKYEELRGKLVKYEEISDRIEYEIAAFLNEVSVGDISKSTSARVKAMYKVIGELESLGDSGEAISRILNRRNQHKQVFDEDTVNKLLSMVAAVDQAYGAMLDNLVAAHKGKLAEISNAYKAEECINNLRNYLREAQIEEIENGARNYQAGVYYMDIVSELERMGDFIINISQALEKAYV